MADAKVWDEKPGPVVGNTPFGFFDNEVSFVQDAPKFAIWSGRKLGYPTIEIELYDVNFYAAYEEAINEYSAQVNYYNIINNLHYLQGQPLNTSVQHHPVAGNLAKVIALSKKYGTLVGAKGEATWYSASLNVTSSIQNYDLSLLLPDYADIVRIHHYQYPAAMQFYDPYSGMGGGLQNIANEFGWYPNATNYVMTPIYSDLLRIQQLEMSQDIRKSGYSFELNNNILKLFPLPNRSFKLYFDYVLSTERDNPFYDNKNLQPSGSMSDFSDVNYQHLEYRLINEPGKQWIRNYAYACVLEMLGNVRGKYSSIPIPDADVTLDGETLRGNGVQLKTELVERLKMMLEETLRIKSLENQMQESDNLETILSRVPLSIYIA